MLDFLRLLHLQSIIEDRDNNLLNNNQVSLHKHKMDQEYLLKYQMDLLI
jgi:hypothetical protein